MTVRSRLARVIPPLRRSKPCGCRYPPGWTNDEIPQAHRVDDRANEEPRYHSRRKLLIITEWVRVVEYRCDECGDTFEIETGEILEREVNWVDD